MKIKKASPGLDPDNRLGALLGPGFEVEEYDPSVPLSRQVTDAAVLLVRSVPVPAEVIAAAPALKLIQRPGAHLHAVDVACAIRRGVYVARVPAEVLGASRDVAEHALFLLLALAKRYGSAAAQLAARVVGSPRTHGVRGRTLALVGIGPTGEELARLAVGIGMRVTAVKRTVDRRLQDELGLAFLGGVADLPRVLAEADFVSLHLPLAPETTGFIGTRELGLMKRGSFLINIARGPLVDKGALLDALRSGWLGGAGLDVFWEEPPDPDDPLLRLANVVATPHIAGATHDVDERLARIVAANVERVARGEPPRYLVEAAGGP
jgi:phosphoglycerate dehydrogenase-like enzyme